MLKRLPYQRHGMIELRVLKYENVLGPSACADGVRRDHRSQ